MIACMDNAHDFKGLTDWFPVFRAGRQTDSLGRTAQYTRDDLDQMVANHDPAHPAPHVITHKELYSPFAYARTAGLKRDGDVLLAKAEDVDPQFEKLVRDGRLSERSVRIRKTDQGWRVGHIAWLGAEPPAVEGLAPVQFEQDDQSAHDYQMDTLATNVLVRMMRRMREFLIGKYGVDEADRVMPDYEIEVLNDDVRQASTVESTFSAGASRHEDNPPAKKPDEDTDMSDFTQADIDAAREEARQQAAADFQQQQDDLRTQLDEERRARLQAEFQADVNAWTEENLVLPVQTEGLLEFMLKLSDAEDAEFEFSAGDEDKKVTPLAWFRDFVGSLKAHDLTREQGAGSGGAVDATDANALARAAREFQQAEKDAGRDISMAAAMHHVVTQAED